jgi:hypothetical protein
LQRKARYCALFPAMIRTLLGLSAAALLFFATSSAGNASSSANGVLEGQISILQSRGTELADDASPQPKKNPCADCPVVVMSKDGKNEIAQVAVDAEGRFRVNLPAGDYVLDLKGHGPRRMRSTARPFSVVAGQTVRVDLDVTLAVEPM